MPERSVRYGLTMEHDFGEKVYVSRIDREMILWTVQNVWLY